MYLGASSYNILHSDMRRGKCRCVETSPQRILERFLYFGDWRIFDTTVGQHASFRQLCIIFRY